ncbi:putative transposase [Senna tora]|uniref:Putative transposase n=1 Tax=Senna tora TaxID=362788 RepID=A0A834TS53_9FABA|nr:putative transposase [Senna tora]
MFFIDDVETIPLAREVEEDEGPRIDVDASMGRSKRLRISQDASKCSFTTAEALNSTSISPLAQGFSSNLGSDSGSAPTSTTDDQGVTRRRLKKLRMKGNVFAQISEKDSLGQVLGKEQPGRVRGLGFGPSPPQVFGVTTDRIGSIPNGK